MSGEANYVPVVDAIIMQGRDIVVAKEAKTFAGPYIILVGMSEH